MAILSLWEPRGTRSCIRVHGSGALDTGRKSMTESMENMSHINKENPIQQLLVLN